MQERKNETKRAAFCHVLFISKGCLDSRLETSGRNDEYIEFKQELVKEFDWYKLGLALWSGYSLIKQENDIAGHFGLAKDLESIKNRSNDLYDITSTTCFTHSNRRGFGCYLSKSENLQVYQSLTQSTLHIAPNPV